MVPGSSNDPAWQFEDKSIERGERNRSAHGKIETELSVDAVTGGDRWTCDQTHAPRCDPLASSRYEPGKMEPGAKSPTQADAGGGRALSHRHEGPCSSRSLPCQRRAEENPSLVAGDG